tara:strand:- start:8 stop:367 length:360 start_codon:yes stop_codon:yes gene_type:complete
MATPQFKKNIEEFLELEQTSKILSKKLKDTRETKKKLEERIVKHLTDNKMDKAKLNIGKNSLICNESFTTGSLTMSLVFDTLCDILRNEKKAQEICDVIQDIRDENGKTTIGLKIKPRV